MSKPELKSETILIVDDNKTNLKLAHILLSQLGYDVRTALDAEEALKILETFSPHLILMDIQLPGMDGLELTRRLKARAPAVNVTIVALTAYAMKGDEEKMRAAGCDGYISKPIDTHEFPNQVANYLKRRAK